MAITKGNTSSSSRRGEKDLRMTAKDFLFTLGMKFINLIKLQELLLTRQRDEMKRRESLKTGRISDMKKWLWKILLKIASIIYHSHRESLRVPGESDKMKVVIQTREAIFGIVIEKSYHESLLADTLKSMLFEELMEITEDLDEDVRTMVSYRGSYTAGQLWDR